MTRLSLLLAVAVLGGCAIAYASVTIQADNSRFSVGTGIRPDVLFCIDHVCSSLTPAEARHIASALNITAAEQEAKR